MKDSKNPGPFACDYGAPKKTFKEPKSEATSPEGETVGGRPAAPMKKIEVTNVTPYARSAD